MKTLRTTVITLMALCLVGQAHAQNGQVRFRGTVTQDEKSNALAVCYGDTFVEVTVAEVLEDVNHVLVGLKAVDVCYTTALRLVQGEAVEVYGFYWGGTCPKQYCSRVQILERTDYILRLFCCPDNDWLVSGEDMHSIPAGKVGIGTTAPDKKLHVRGDVLIEGQALSELCRPPDGHPSRGGQTARGLFHQSPGRQCRGGRPVDGRYDAALGLEPQGGQWDVHLGQYHGTSAGLEYHQHSGTWASVVTSPTYRLELPNTASAAGRGRANQLDGPTARADGRPTCRPSTRPWTRSGSFGV